MEPVILHLDEDNELSFKVTVEGTENEEVGCRLIIENSSYNLSFKGTMLPDGEVFVVIPTLGKILKEGTYASRLEVIVDDRLFIPLTLDTRFKQALKVTAEAVTRPISRPSMKASASLISSKKAKKPLTEESRSRKDSKLNRDQVRAMLRKEMSRSSTD